jgi:NAD(P)-dependent dehydrogenase (short-subunit alcohol dehydrogenase family)
MSSARGGIIVTGASSGIGAAIAVELARGGWTVGCLSRRGTIPLAADDAAAPLLRGIACDVTSVADSRTAVEGFVGSGVPVEGLVNAAGMHREAPSAELDPAELRAILEVNLVAAVRMCQLLRPYLADSGGLIVNIGSFYENRGVPWNLAYAASKAAIASITRTLAVEWARQHIAVLDVAPGYVLTELNREFLSDRDNRSRIERRIPARRVGEADEVARVVRGLFEHPTPFFTGASLYIDGGQGVSL